MSDVLEILKRGDNSLEALLRAVLLDSENKVPTERLRIVGALSAGAIIESGSNVNGRYIKFADGTLICTHTMNVSLSSNDYIFKDSNWTLPHATVGDVYKLVCNAAGYTDDSTTNNHSLYIGTAYQDGITYLWNTGTNSSMQKTAAAIRSGSSWSLTSCSVKLLSIGRWKA